MSIQTEDLVSFSSGCFEVARALMELERQGYDCLLIPCRGAFPALTGTIEALKTIEGGMELLERFYAPYSHLTLEKVHRRKGDFKLLILPFTAHVKLPEEYRLRYGFQVHIDEIVKSIRRWAVRLTFSFLKDAYERIRDPYFRLYMRILSMIGEDRLVKLYEKFPKCNRMIYLDTVISGRASHTILTGFREAGYKPYTILMIDRYGAKLNPKYLWVFRQLEHQGLARLIPLSRLVSEDTSSALLGVSAILYPTVIMAGWNRLKPYGAVTWHPAVGLHFKVFVKFWECLRDCIMGDEAWIEKLRELNRSLESVMRLPEEIPSLKCESEIERVEETRAKAVNIYLTHKASESIVKDI